MPRQDVQVDLLYNGTWNSVPVYVRDPITITRGRADEQGGAVPSSASVTADNRDGTYNPRNPVSPLYGLAGRNTPARIWLGSPNMVGASAATATDSATQVAPSVDAPAGGLLVCAWAAPAPSAAYTVPAGMTAGTQGASSALVMRGAQQIVPAGPTGTRTATLSEADGYVAASVFIQGPAAISIGSVTVAGNTWNWTPASSGDILIVISAFERPAVPAAPSDTDGGGWVLLADTGDLFVSDSSAGWIRLMAWAKVVRTAGVTHQITLPGADAATTVSHLARVPAADVGGDWGIRHHGEVATWQPERTVDFDPGNGLGDAWSKLEIAGLLRRLSQGTAPLLSTIRRLCTTVAVDQCAAYWPCEDGADAKQVASGLPGGQPMRIVSTGTGAVTFAAASPFPGSAPLLQLGDGTSLVGTVPSTVDTAGAAYTRMLISIPDTGYADLTTMASWYTSTGRAAIVYGTLSGGSIDLRLYDSTGTQVASTGFFTIDSGVGFNGVTTYISLELVRSGSNTSWLMSFAYLRSNGNIKNTIISGTFTGVVVGRIVSVDIGGGGAMGGTIVGHIGVAAAQQWFFGSGEFLTGHSGEPAGRRILRICAEQGIPASVAGDPDDTVPMGPQPVDTLVNVLAEIERTDAGILYEPRDQLGLVYRTLGSLYNQDPVLTLDWAAGEVTPPLTPVLDDKATRNDITAKRADGSSARATLDSGPMSVQDPPVGVGQYAVEVDVNPQDDSALANLANWYLRSGTVDETRFPQVTVNMDEVAAAADVDIGDRIVITGVPDDLSPDDIDLIAVGYTETIGSHTRTITFNCVPASAYDVAVYDTDRYDHPNSTLTSAIDTDDTTLSVHDGGNHWTTDDNDFPFDVDVDGERMTVTDIAANDIISQTWTVTRAVNGVVKAHAAGAPVRLWKTPRYAL